MSIIEQAAKRLEELKRAGIQIPAAFEAPPPAAAPATEAAPAAAEAVTPAAASPAAAAPAVTAEATKVVAPAATPAPAAASAVPVATAPSVVAPTTTSRDVIPAPATALVAETSGRRSREVTLDLSRLAAEGYLVPSQGRSQLAEQMRILKRPLLANAKGESAVRLERPNLILVTSPMPGEGKTFLAMNLAMSIAMEVDHSVLLIDADVLRPSVLSRYGVEPSRGLLDVVGSPGLDLADVMLRTNVPKLNLLSAGTANAKSTELLASGAMEAVLKDLAEKYPDRIIVFDAPPLIPTTESRVLASRVGQVVMVVEAGRTTHAQAAQAYAAVEKCPVVLSVLNKLPASGSGDNYGYYYAT